MYTKKSYILCSELSVACCMYKVLSVVSICTFSIKNANQFFYKKNIKND
jgi:hypothetical protein